MFLSVTLYIAVIYGMQKFTAFIFLKKLEGNLECVGCMATVLYEFRTVDKKKSELLIMKIMLVKNDSGDDICFKAHL